MMKEDTLEKKLEKEITLLRIKAYKLFEFFSSVVIIPKLKYVEVADFYMATDGFYYYYTPELIKLSDDSKFFVFLHELAHIALKHVVKSREPPDCNKQIWNLAREYAANSFVIDLLHISHDYDLNSSILYDRSYSIANYTTTEIYYNLLESLKQKCQQIPKDIDIFKFDKQLKRNRNTYPPREQEIDIENIIKRGQTGKGKNTENKDKDTEAKDKDLEYDDEYIIYDDGNTLPDAVITANNETDENGENIEDKIDSMISAGSIPGNISNVLDVQNTTYDYKKLLRLALSECLRTDYTYKRWNKRHLYRNMYYPALYKENPKVVFAVDTSGSMSNQDVADAFDVINKLVKTRDAKVHLLQFDFDIKEDRELKHTDKVVKRSGYGGTSYHAVMDRIANIKSNLAIIFTDLMPYGGYPEKPNKRIIWLYPTTGKEVPKNLMPPYGTVIIFPKK